MRRIAPCVTCRPSRRAGWPTAAADENDTTAAPGSPAISFYDSIASTAPRAYLELEGASHFAPNSPNTVIAANTISRLKRNVDDDERHRPFRGGDARGRGTYP